jgi:hypothetical protein
MPPLLVADQLNRIWYRKLFGLQVRFRFFPQCSDCSSLQGGILSKAKTVLVKQPKNSIQKLFDGSDMMKLPILHSKRYYHGLQPRISHLTGTVLGSIAVVCASRDEITTGNQQRYERLHQRVSDWWQTLRDHDLVVDIRSAWRPPK